MGQTIKKLPKVFKRKWLKALRSGEYEQGKSVLRNSKNEYCCLGVAAHICGVISITGKQFIELESGIIGISKIPELLIGDLDNAIVRKLSIMNDCGESFNKIADYIEKYL